MNISLLLFDLQLVRSRKKVSALLHFVPLMLLGQLYVHKWNFQPKRISRTDIACCTLNAKMKTHTSKIKALEIAHGMRLFGQRGAFALAAFFGFRSTLRKEILATDLLQLYFASSSTLKLRVSNCKFLNTMYCVFYYLAIRH